MSWQNTYKVTEGAEHDGADEQHDESRQDQETEWDHQSHRQTPNSLESYGPSKLPHLDKMVRHRFCDRRSGGRRHGKPRQERTGQGAGFGKGERHALATCPPHDGCGFDGNLTMHETSS